MAFSFYSKGLKLISRCDKYQLCARNIHKRSVKEILKATSSNNSHITACGWIKSVREYKEVVFIHMTDGSCFQPLQVVATPDKIPSKASFGCCIEIQGNVKASPGTKQKVEVMAENIKVLGECESVEYPFKYKDRHSLDYQRQFLHLRNRQPFFTSLLRIRNSATQAMHTYFQTNEFIQISTPVLTSNDCEGAGEVFQVQPANRKLIEDMEEAEENQSEEPGQFFNRPAYLTVSGQLHLEVMSGSFGKVYTMNPTFRAENAKSRHHLCEFCMVEAEQTFITSVEEICQVIQGLIKFTTRTVLNQSEEDVNFFQEFVAPKRHSENIEKIMNKAFIRLEYTEAIALLQKCSSHFQFKPEWGCDLQKEHEKWLVSHFENHPVFILNFPASIKPFYARQNDNLNTVSAVDLLVPEVGELCGGSLREERYDILHTRLVKEGLEESYDWYLDLRRFGTAPHGGFGVGFERYIQALLGIQNIKDTLPFPRYERNCKL